MSHHVGRHHFHSPSCSEYRPVDGRTECPRCGPVCPGCGATYAQPKTRLSVIRRCPHCEETAPSHVTAEQFDAHVQRCKEGT